MRALAAALLLAAACGPHPTPAAAPSNHGAPRGPDTSIRQVDFLNHTYDLGTIGDEGTETVTVKDGDFERPEDPSGDRMGFVHVDRPVYGDVDGDGVEDAIVIVVDNTGGTGMFDMAYVYTMRGGQLATLAVVGGGDRGDGGLHEVTAEPGGVKVERYQSIEGDGACCPSKLAVEHWRWTGKDLAIDDARTTTIDNPDRQN